MARLNKLALILICAGCATQPTQKPMVGPKTPTQVEQAEQAKKYLETTELIYAETTSQKCVATALEKPKLSTWFERLNACVTFKNWELVEKFADDMAKSDIQSPWPSYYRSVAANERGEVRRAIWMLDLAEKKTGRSDLFRYQRGKIELRLGNQAKAMEEFEAALTSFPKLVSARLYLARNYRSDGEIEKALTHYEILRGNRAQEKESVRYIADQKFNQDKKQEALELYQRVIELGAEDATPYLRSAQVNEESFKQKPAETKFLFAAIELYRRLQSDLKSGKVKTSSAVDPAAKIKELEARLQKTPTKKQALNDVPPGRSGK